MANPIQTTRVGEVRPSQLMFTYSVGALIDLPKISVIVTGLDDWPDSTLNIVHTVAESRLLAGCAISPVTASKSMVRPARHGNRRRCPQPDFDPAYYIGVPVATFPRWMVCPQLPPAWPR